MKLDREGLRALAEKANKAKAPLGTYSEFQAVANPVTVSTLLAVLDECEKALEAAIPHLPDLTADSDAAHYALALIRGESSIPQERRLTR